MSICIRLAATVTIMMKNKLTELLQQQLSKLKCTYVSREWLSNSGTVYDIMKHLLDEYTMESVVGIGRNKSNLASVELTNEKR